MNTKQTKKKTPTPTLLEVLDEWGRQNEKRMQRKLHPQKPAKHN